MVMVTISVPSGMSGSAAAWASGGGGAFAVGAAAALGASSGQRCRGAARSARIRRLVGCGAGLAALMADASSPSLKITAIGVLTATSAVPSGTRILPSVPSSTASTSMVALSVSISAITSPDLTVSPSFFSHLARLPFSIVGDSAGINTSVGMGATVSLKPRWLSD